jgi:ABC-type Mn2+/Zn2+ transport system ATPase subunit
VTHDVHAVHHFSDRVLVLNRRLLFDGTPDRLLSDPALAAAAFDLAAGEEVHPGHEELRP